MIDCLVVCLLWVFLVVLVFCFVLFCLFWFCGVFVFVLFCIEITFFLWFCHCLNFNLHVSGAILLFSVTYVNWGDVLSPFPKEQTITSHECNPSGRKHCRPFNLWEEEWKPALGSWRLTNKKDAQLWSIGTSQWDISEVPEVLCHLSRS